jgi:hypothetical protein
VKRLKPNKSGGKMKSLKHFLVLAIALCAIPSVSKAQTVRAIGGGSSAIFLELGQGAVNAGSPTGSTCSWTYAKNATYMYAQDSRGNQVYGAGVPVDQEAGDFWVTWNIDAAGGGVSCANPGPAGDANINVYSYLKLDSVIGDRCYFMVDNSGATGCLMQIISTNGSAVAPLPANNAASNITCGNAGNLFVGTPGANKLNPPNDTAGGLPCVILNAINGLRFMYAGTDIRPEDAKFATYRMLQPCGQALYRNPYDLGYRLTYGLGYALGGYPAAHPAVGEPVLAAAAYGGGQFTVFDFDISGTADPITGKIPPAFAVTPLGAQPIVVGVGALAGDPILSATDISGFTLALFYEGVLGRSTDLNGVGGAVEPVNVLVREPLSGTYNTMEFSNPNSSQFHTSQDDNFCSGNVAFSQTMNINSPADGGLAFRSRVIGTGNMTAQLNAPLSNTQPRLGYFFWSVANAKGLNNVKYLTVNGVDPILTAYGVGAGGAAVTPGALPQAGGAHPAPNPGDVTLAGLNAGDYSIWSVVRLVGPAGNAGIANLAGGLHLLDATQNDYVPLGSLNVWHAHFPIFGIVGNYANGTTIAGPGNDLCNAGGAQAEAGGDVGGTNVLKSNNADFCSDFGNPQGLINKTN